MIDPSSPDNERKSELSRIKSLNSLFRSLSGLDRSITQFTISFDVRVGQVNRSIHKFVRCQGWTGQSLHYCGDAETVPEFRSIGRTVQVNFRTDSSTNGRGFLLSYQLVCTYAS